MWIYNPNTDKNHEVKNGFYNILQKITDKIGETREIIMMGDFNRITGSRTRDDIPGEFGEDEVNNN